MLGGSGGTAGLLRSAIVVTVLGLAGGVLPDSASAVSFSGPTTYRVGDDALSLPWGIESADFNSDSHPDLVVAMANNSRVALLPGDGNGGFGPQTQTFAGYWPRGVAVGDVNGDVHPDVAVAQNSNTAVGLLLGNGDGTFAPASHVDVGAAGLWEVA